MLSLAGCFGGCDYDRFDPPEPHPADVPVPTMSIATLRSLYKGDPVGHRQTERGGFRQCYDLGPGR